MEAQAAAVAAPAQAAARSSAQPPALRPQSGNGMTYFRNLGDVVSRWIAVDGEWKRSSPRGKRFMRGLPRHTDDSEEKMRARFAHAEYCMGAFLDARNLCPKLSLTSKIEIDPRLFCVDLACIVAAATVGPPVLLLFRIKGNLGVGPFLA